MTAKLATGQAAVIPTAPKPAVAAINKDIILNLSNPTKILFTICSSGESGERMLHDEKLSLTRGLIYKLPIENKTLSSKNNFGIKLELESSDNLHVLNVHDGIVTIETIIHGYIVNDKQVLGSLF